VKEAIQLLKQGDIFGMITSFACLVHCIITPFFFLGPHQAVNHYHGLISFHSLFLLLAFSAVISAARFATLKIKLSLWLFIICLTIGVIFENQGFFFQCILYTGSLGLIVTHLFNLKGQKH